MASAGGVSVGSAGAAEDDLLVLGAADVDGLLAGREAEVVGAVRDAYLAHGRGQSSLPHSIFLRFPGDDVNRIIGLPAYLGDGFETSGMKWIASYPGNHARGLPRASAVLVLNSTETGRPLALLEGSIISARRTAASAALAARILLDEPPGVVGLVGTGLINREVVRFLRAVFPELRKLLVYDLREERMRSFSERLGAEDGGVSVEAAASLAEVLGRCPLVSFATTAVRPHVPDLHDCPPGAVLLHVSLRDLEPAAILSADNVVDDVDHVLRAQTSVHLAEGVAGGRGFIRCTLAELMEGSAPAKEDPDAVTVFSPFGLGVLDLAVASMVYGRGVAEGRGVAIPAFHPGE